MKKYADSTLCKLSKQELIDYIRCLERNLESAEECNERQYQMLMNYEKLAEEDNGI